MEQYFTEAGKYYRTPVGNLPSVTTIIENMRPPEEKLRLQKWRDKNSTVKQTAIKERGTFLHQQIENYFRSGYLPKVLNVDPTQYEQENPQNYWQQICRTLKGHKTENLILGNNRPAIEYITYHPELKYAGTFDWLGYWNGELTLIDFKTTRKHKQQKYLKDQKLQLAAYRIAIEFQFNLKISQAASIYFLPNQSQIFYLSNSELEEYSLRWQQIITEFYQKFSAKE